MSSTNRTPGVWSGLLPNLMAGSLVTLVTLSYAISYAALIFSGPELQPHLTAGVHSALMAAWIVGLVVALGSSFHFAVAGPDSNATAILAVMAAGVAARLAQHSGQRASLAPTVLVMLAGSAVLGGLLVYVIGALRRGRLIRFLPYPVVGGFLAGTGYLIIIGAFKVLTGCALTLETILAPPEIPPVAWAVAAFVALCLLIIPRYVKHYLVMPVVLVAGVALFYVGLHFSGLGVETAREKSLLLQPLPPGNLAMPPLFARAQLDLVRWEALFPEWQNFLAMVIVVIITILLNATGLDLATQYDVDFDRELRVNGLAGIFSGVCGGITGYISISRSLLNFKAGACSRAAGIIMAALCLGATFLFTPAVAYFPRPVLAGVLLYLGLSMLREWIWDAFFKLPLIEYVLVAGMLLLIAGQGMISGVAFGLVVATAFFAYSYSQTSCIKHCFSSSTHFSNKERALEQTVLLREKGRAARALALQGYIFFGTSSAIVETCRALVEKEQARFLLLDFRLVQGLDASAVLSFNKLEQICTAHEARLLLSALSPEVQAVLEQTKFLSKRGVKVFADMDHGLEWVEDNLLYEVAQASCPPAVPAAAAPGLADAALGSMILAEVGLRRILSSQFTAQALDVLITYCETRKLEDGAALFQRGDPGDSLYFIERGEFSVLMRLDGGQTKRLRTFGPGTIVGEMGLYSKQPRSADVVACGSCRVRKLSAGQLAQLEREHPEVAIEFHTFVIRLMSSRLAAANEEIRGLL